MARKFAHLIDPQSPHYAGKEPILSSLAGRLVEPWFHFLPPRRVAHVRGVKSPYEDAEGWLISAGPVCGENVSASARLRKAGAVVRLARRVGARVVGLGPLAFTLEEGVLARDPSLRISSGTVLAAGLAANVVKESARLLDLDLGSAEAAILGACGTTGLPFALTLSGVVTNLTLVGSDEGTLDRMATELLTGAGVSAQISTKRQKSLRGADLVVVLPGAEEIEPSWIKTGAILLDVAEYLGQSAFPEREDVLSLRGGLMRVPGDVDFGLDLPYPHGVCDASLAETILLTIEEGHESRAADRSSMEQIDAMCRLASKHGFQFAGLQGSVGIITAADITRIREKSGTTGANCDPARSGRRSDHRILDTQNACR